MGRIFNASADCHPDLHYMVDLKDRLKKITSMVDAGQYFTINWARQYGKTTTLLALAGHLKKEHTVQCRYISDRKHIFTGICKSIRPVVERKQSAIF